MKKNGILQLFQFHGVVSIVYYIAFLALLWYLIVPHTSLFYFNNIFNPMRARLNKEDIVLVKGEEFRIKIQSVNKKLSFSSTDIKVADVNILGNVTAYRVGTTVVKVKYKGEILKCRVRVIDISKRKLTIKTSKSTKLSMKGTRSGTRWSSSNVKIVRVNRFGKVTGVSKGTAKIYAKAEGKKLSCTVTVY